MKGEREMIRFLCMYESANAWWSMSMPQWLASRVIARMVLKKMRKTKQLTDYSKNNVEG